MAAFEDPDWDHRAACKGSDATLFFGPNGFESKRDREAREAAAIAICGTCPVIDPCRELALETGETYGVWGGLSETARRSLLVRTTVRAS